MSLIFEILYQFFHQGNIYFLSYFKKSLWHPNIFSEPGILGPIGPVRDFLYFSIRRIIWSERSGDPSSADDKMNQEIDPSELKKNGKKQRDPVLSLKLVLGGCNRSSS